MFYEDVKKLKTLLVMPELSRRTSYRLLKFIPLRLKVLYLEYSSSSPISYPNWCVATLLLFSYDNGLLELSWYAGGTVLWLSNPLNFACTAFYIILHVYLYIASIVLIELICFSHVAVAQLHDFEDIVTMFLFHKLDIHLLVWGENVEYVKIA